VLQAVLDKLWSSAHEFTELNECGNPSAASRERWQEYAEHALVRWLEYHSPSAADRTVEAKRARGGKFDWSGPVPAVPEARPAQLQSSAETSDNAARLLYDVLEAIGPFGAILREEKSEFLKRKGAELIELWRRGEHLGVLRGERP